jgi:hypothetical protein
MSKSILCWTATGAFAAAVLTFGITPSVALNPSAALSAAVDGNTVPVAQQQRRKGKGKQSKQKISPEHQQQIRQHVPQEFHQYIPGMSSGGGAGGAAGAAGAAGR